MININTNLSSLIAQKSLQNSTSSLNQVIERLTTGCKLNYSSDNAANFSISTAMTTQLSSYLVAEENVEMGLDLINTASASIDLISNHLERIRELATQAECGTYGEASLKAINTEVNTRLDEIERIYASSEYNGVKFGGEQEEAKFIHDIDRRDTSTLTSLASVDVDEALTSGVYSIKTAEELAKLATMTNNALISDGVEFVLGADIDLSGYTNWTPIGNNTNKFTGDFDGNGYTISNLSITSRGTQLGLFGRTSRSDIKNVALESVNIVLTGASANDKHIGGLVGYLSTESSIYNCYVTGRIDARSQAKIIGGIVGQVYNKCNIESCYSECELVNMNSMAGGLLGCLESNSILKNSFSSGDVSGKSSIGGLIGVILTSATVEESYCTGDVNGNQSGGMVGSIHTNSSIINSWTSSKVKALSGNSTAGIAYSAAGSRLENVYVLDKNNNHAGVFVASYRSGGSGDVVIEDSYYSSYYENLSIPFAPSSKFIINNVLSYQGENPFTYSNHSNNYTLYPKISFQVGISSVESSTISVNTGFVLRNINQLRGIGLQQGKYLERCDLLLKDLNNKSVEYGAIQNRLDSVLDEIALRYKNLLSSRSTLSDADVTKETSEYIRYQILQQASSTLLSTANQLPSIALQLL